MEFQDIESKSDEICLEIDKIEQQEEYPKTIKVIVGEKKFNVQTEYLIYRKEEKPSFLVSYVLKKEYLKQKVLNISDKDPQIFEAVLRYYRTGLFSVCKCLLEQVEFLTDELNFWGIEISKEVLDKENKSNLSDNVTDKFIDDVIDYINKLIENSKINQNDICYPYNHFHFMIADITSDYSINNVFLHNINLQRRKIFDRSGHYVFLRYYNDTSYKGKTCFQLLWPLNKSNKIWIEYYSLVSMYIEIDNKKSFEELEKKYTTYLKNLLVKSPSQSVQLKKSDAYCIIC